MHLEELAALGLPQGEPRVPEWSFGFWRRKSITFANGVTDEGTRVFWLQSRGLTADLRLPARKFDSTSVRDKARFEGGLAQTSWDGQKMSWSDWTSFQLHDKWPEPALLTRIGDCLIEFAPSGIYVEDWRFQPSARGLWVGLRLIEERDLGTGIARHRGGGLIITGDHAALIKGRPAPLDISMRVDRFVDAHKHDAQAMERVFAFEASYARKTSYGAFEVAASTIAAREGAKLMALDGFSFDAASGLVLQHCYEDGRDIMRSFSIDTLEANRDFQLTTLATLSSTQWLDAERETLLRDAAPLAPLAP